MERVQAGALTVLADPSKLPMREATQDAWRMLDAFYGDAAWLIREPVILRVVSAFPQTNDAVVRIPADMERDELALAIARVARVPLGDNVFTDWLGMPLAPGVDAAALRRVVYVELVTAPITVVRRCFEGDLPACRDALELELESREGAVRRWWSPAERRRIVTEIFAPVLQRDRPALRAGLAACAQGADSACVRILEAADPLSLPRPLSPSARATLLDLVLVRGGRSAYARLVSDSMTALPERLPRIADTPLDSLVRHWRDGVIAARPRNVSVPLTTAAASLIWFGLAATLALRSSRWRLG
jgi:hypothetical protein